MKNTDKDIDNMSMLKVDKRCRNCLYFRDMVWCTDPHPDKVDGSDFCETFEIIKENE